LYTEKVDEMGLWVVDHNSIGWSMVHHGSWADAGGQFTGFQLMADSGRRASPQGLRELEEVIGVVTCS
jgi:hypothetical protein